MINFENVRVKERITALHESLQNEQNTQATNEKMYNLFPMHH